MKFKKYFEGGILGTIGFILSPLSWWNDLLVNIPLAYGFGYIVSLINKSFFLPAVIVGYWITNILGIFLMHKGFVKITAKEDKNYTRKDFIKDLLMSVLYTLLIVALVYFKVFELPKELISGN